MTAKEHWVANLKRDMLRKSENAKIKGSLQVKTKKSTNSTGDSMAHKKS